MDYDEDAEPTYDDGGDDVEDEVPALEEDDGGDREFDDEYDQNEPLEQDGEEHDELDDIPEDDDVGGEGEGDGLDDTRVNEDAMDGVDDDGDIRAMEEDEDGEAAPVEKPQSSSGFNEENSETESDAGGDLPPKGTFEELTFKDLVEYHKQRSKKRRPSKRGEKLAKKQKKFKEIPDKFYVRAPVVLRKVSSPSNFRKWLGWATDVWKMQKVARRKRLGHRDLGYHNNKPLTAWALRQKAKREREARGKSRLTVTVPTAPPKKPDPIDDQKLITLLAKSPPPPTPGVLDLPQDAILPLLNAWGFIRTFRFPLEFDDILGDKKNLGLKDFVDLLSNTTENLPSVNGLFARIAAHSLGAGIVDIRNDLLAPEGKKAWMSVNPLTWQYHVHNHLEGLEEKRIQQLAEEMADEGNDSKETEGKAAASSLELQYYGLERGALSRDEALLLPLSTKARLLPLIIGQALDNSKLLHKHLDEGVSQLRECRIRHKKATTQKKQKTRKDVVIGCATVYNELVAQVVKQNGGKETKVFVDKKRVEFVGIADKYIRELEMSKQSGRDKEMKALLEKFPLRATTLCGKDRHFRRYYAFGTPFEKVADAIYVFDPKTKKWGVYDTQEKYDALVKWLTCLGIRENALLESLKEHKFRFATKKAVLPAPVNDAPKSPPTTPARQKKRGTRTPRSKTKTQKSLNEKEATPGPKQEERAIPEKKGKGKSYTKKKKRRGRPPKKAKRKAKEEESSENEIEDEDSPYITKKLTRNQKREEMLMNFTPPDVNEPLRTSEKEKMYFSELMMSKRELIASQLLFRDDGEYLPVCYVCQEVLGEEEWHCPYSHRTFSKKKCPAEEFAILLEDAKKNGNELTAQLNSVSRRFKILKCLLMDIECAIPEESTLDKSRRDVRNTRDKWISTVKYAIELSELAQSLLQLQVNLKADWLRPWFDSTKWQAAVRNCKSESELAVLLFAFDRAVLYNLALKAHTESEVDKDGAVKCTSDFFPTEANLPKTKEISELMMDTKGMEDIPEPDSDQEPDPRTRLNRVHPTAPTIFRRATHRRLYATVELDEGELDKPMEEKVDPKMQAIQEELESMRVDREEKEREEKREKRRAKREKEKQKDQDAKREKEDDKDEDEDEDEDEDVRPKGRRRYMGKSPFIKAHRQLYETYQPEMVRVQEPSTQDQ